MYDLYLTRGNRKHKIKTEQTKHVAILKMFAGSG